MAYAFYINMTHASTHRVSTCFPFGQLSERELSIKNGKCKFADQCPMRILIAEDDYITRRVILLYLRHLGYEAKSVENGQECFNEALANSYDLILTDIDMPEMSGIECAKQLRSAGVEIPIIALSASCLFNAREDCLCAGMDEFMPKPVPPEKLQNILRDVYEGKLRK